MSDTVKKKKACPDCVIDAGGWLIKLRHAVKSPDDAKKVGVDSNSDSEMKGLFEATWNSVIKAMDYLTDNNGIAQMEFGPGLSNLLDVQSISNGNGAWVACLCAHNEFKRVLDRHGIENPTNQQLVRTAGLLNKR